MDIYDILDEITKPSKAESEDWVRKPWKKSLAWEDFKKPPLKESDKNVIANVKINDKNIGVINVDRNPTTYTVSCSEDIAKSRSFFDDNMLDYLLEEIMEKKAKETSEELKKLVEKGKKDEINKFANSIDHVLFNKPYTIVFWKDKTKTVVKCQKGDIYDKEKGLAMAIIKKIFSNSNYFNTIFKKWIPEEDD